MWDTLKNSSLSLKMSWIMNPLEFKKHYENVSGEMIQAFLMNGKGLCK